MDERTITPEALHDLTDDELTRLANLCWYAESVEASWTVQEEIIRALRGDFRGVF